MTIVKTPREQLKKRPYWGRERCAAAWSPRQVGTSFLVPRVPWSWVPPLNQRLWCEAPTDSKSKESKVAAFKCDVFCHPLGVHQIAKHSIARGHNPTGLTVWGSVASQGARGCCVCMHVHQGGAWGKSHRGLEGSGPMTASRRSAVDYRILISGLWY